MWKKDWVVERERELSFGHEDRGPEKREGGWEADSWDEAAAKEDVAISAILCL